MRKVLPVVIILIVAFGVYYFFAKNKDGEAIVAAKEGPLKATKHSLEFNSSVDTMMSAYFSLHDAFVEADTIRVKQTCNTLAGATEKVNIDELKKDTSGIYPSALEQLNQVKESIKSICVQKDLATMRKDFQWLSESLYPLLKTIHYEGKKLYWQNCPMAFGDNQEASWISNTEEIANPYLGKKHPEFKATMLHCGEVKDSIMAQ
ncbi:MAG: DUF3347 domain-containing protein [Sphingobacteriales bacterium]|nr:DUF3347 domain-containing protein [Sphingobacteriales bacterium]